jgi:hypothetical protein
MYITHAAAQEHNNTQQQVCTCTLLPRWARAKGDQLKPFLREHGCIQANEIAEAARE